MRIEPPRHKDTKANSLDRATRRAQLNGFLLLMHGWPSCDVIRARLRVFVPLCLIFLSMNVAKAEVLDKQKMLEKQTFWDNRDWDWYKENIPFFECPDPEIEKIYYYRWELITKHLTYGSP